MSLGVGLFYPDIPHPYFDTTTNLFLTASGLVYVLTHECDVDATNDRPLNTHVVVCPIIEFGHFIQDYQLTRSEADLVSFLANLGRHDVARAFYLPPMHPELPYGGVLYFNLLTSTHVSVFGAPAHALTGYGLQRVDLMLEQALRRPKDATQVLRIG